MPFGLGGGPWWQYQNNQGWFRNFWQAFPFKRFYCRRGFFGFGRRWRWFWWQNYYQNLNQNTNNNDKNKN